MSEPEAIPVIGGMLNGARVHRPDQFEDWQVGYCLVHVQGRPAYVPRQWPRGSVVLGIALVRIYGENENVWPRSAVSALYAPRESQSV